MRSTELKDKILLMLNAKELYGYEINKLLSNENVSINISRLYSVLNDMLGEGLLSERWEKSSTGPRKKMYSLTEKGRDVLNESLLQAIGLVHLFYIRYLGELYPEVDVFGPIFKIVTDDLKPNYNVVYITNAFVGIHEAIVNRIQKNLKDGKLYLIVPGKSTQSGNFEDINFLDGAYDNIPFKKNYLNRLVVVGVPESHLIKETVDEWDRVVVEGGRLIIITPTILIKKKPDPITIGDFVEIYEHQYNENQKAVNADEFYSALNSHFKELKEYEAVHMSFITAYK